MMNKEIEALEGIKLELGAIDKYTDELFDYVCDGQRGLDIIDKIWNSAQALYHEAAKRIELPEQNVIALPCDADGVPIRLGDILYITHDNGTIDVGQVSDIHLQTMKCTVTIVFEYDSGVTAFPEEFRHAKLWQNADKETSARGDGEILKGTAHDAQYPTFALGA